MSAYRSESLKLYRDILRASRCFTWNNEQGIPWSHILRINARKEFDVAKYERDPAIITKMLFIGRQCLNDTMDKYTAAAQKLRSNIDNNRTT